ncbi:NUDIX hydrolase [Paenibacillus mesophilus]|uniref:NUDIX hydrolase n=1 Tax=Paenibacillus mesophilus TaxID=2582849 RepID=UPI00110ED1DC|nr:NUDIX domain-containing protein [Paenibacillus mesophilus]TMV45891.1 NUDIX hydrolase [Paenibacillus mesophilus]
MKQEPVLKVTAYLTAVREGEQALLVFEEEDFEHLGLQVPGGTVMAGESLEDALLREIREEAGIEQAVIRAYLGEHSYVSEKLGCELTRHYYWLEATELVPGRFTHVVTSDDEDNGWIYHYRWIPFADSPPVLYGQLGQYLVKLRELHISASS